MRALVSVLFVIFALSTVPNNYSYGQQSNATAFQGKWINVSNGALLMTITVDSGGAISVVDNVGGLGTRPGRLDGDTLVAAGEHTTNRYHLNADGTLSDKSYDGRGQFRAETTLKRGN